MCPHHGSLLPSFVFNALVTVTTQCAPVGVHTKHHSKAQECCSSSSKYRLCRTAVPFSWCPQELSCGTCHGPTFLCASQLLVSLGGCQLELRSLECDHKFVLVATQALSAAVEKEGDSRTLLYQWVYTQLKTHLCCLHGMFVIDNCSARLS